MHPISSHISRHLIPFRHIFFPSLLIEAEAEAIGYCLILRSPLISVQLNLAVSAYMWLHTEPLTTRSIGLLTICLSRLLSSAIPSLRKQVPCSSTRKVGIVFRLVSHWAETWFKCTPSSHWLTVWRFPSCLFRQIFLDPAHMPQNAFNKMTLASVQPRIKLEVYSREWLWSFRIPLPGDIWTRYRANMFPVHSIHFFRSRSLPYNFHVQLTRETDASLFVVPLHLSPTGYSRALFVYSRVANTRTPESRHSLVPCSFTHSL